MPSMQHTPTFWTQVATAFKGNNAVVFDLFNEPYPDASNNWSDMTAAWRCLRDGGTCTGIDYEVAGMQDLVDAVRATGASNVVMTARPDLDQRPEPVAGLQADRPDRQPDGVVALLQLQRLRHRVLLGQPDRRGRRPGARARRRDRPGHLRPRLHRPGDGLARPAPHRLHRVDLEPVGLHGRQRPHRGLQRHADPRYGEGFRAHLLTVTP